MSENIITNNVRIKLNKRLISYGNMLFVLLFNTAFAQTIISGKIVDEHNKSMPFVHISLENTNLGTISNETWTVQTSNKWRG